MKACTVWCDDEWSLLIWADTPNKAKLMGFFEGPLSRQESEYIDWSAKRNPQYDEYSDAEKIVDMNSELPEGAPDFYNDED